MIILVYLQKVLIRLSDLNQQKDRKYMLIVPSCRSFRGYSRPYMMYMYSIDIKKCSNVSPKPILKNLLKDIGYPSCSETPKAMMVLGEPIGVMFPPRFAPMINFNLRAPESSRGEEKGGARNQRTPPRGLWRLRTQRYTSNSSTAEPVTIFPAPNSLKWSITAHARFWSVSTPCSPR